MDTMKAYIFMMIFILLCAIIGSLLGLDFNSILYGYAIGIIGINIAKSA